MKRRLIFSLAIAMLLGYTVALPTIAATELNRTASVSVNESINITLTGDTIAFGNVTPPVTDQGATGQSDGSPAIKVNVASETNVNVDIGIKGSVTTGSLALNNWKYSTTFTGTKISIPSNYGTAVYTNVTPGTSRDFYHWITVPTGTASGTHTISVTYKAVKTGEPF